MTIAQVQTTQVVTVGENTIEIVTVGNNIIDVVTVGSQGPAGFGVPAGGTTGQSLIKLSDADYNVGWGNDADAESLRQLVILGESVSAYRVLYADIDGKSYLASSDDVLTAQTIRGITIQSGDEDDTVTVISEGEITNNSWNWSGNQSLFLGVGGVITATKPVTGYAVRIGYATSPDTMFISIGPVIILN